MASTVGTTVEWYDFFLYGSAAALVFPHLFFSGLEPEARRRFCRGSRSIPGFVGTANRGGDLRALGRPRSAARLLLVSDDAGHGTVDDCRIGIVPSYASIGMWGAVLFDASPASGRRRRRRVERLGADGRRVGRARKTGPHDQFSADGITARSDSREQRAGHDGIRAERGRVSRMGMAGPVSRQPDPRRDRPLHSHRHSRIAGLREHQGTGQNRARPDQGGDQGELARGCADHAASHGPARAVLHHDNIHPGVRHRSARTEPGGAPQLRLDSRGRRAHGDSSSRFPVRYSSAASELSLSAV